MKDDRPDDLRRANRALLIRLAVVVAVMFGFGFALVPFYDRISKASTAAELANEAASVGVHR